MNITVIGTGYVGLVAGVCFADSGRTTICVDNNSDKINALKNGKIPIYEPGLEDLLKTARNKIEFTTDIASAVARSEILFIAVGTPETADGSADMRPLMMVVQEIAQLATARKFVVLKSTVPIGTAKEAQNYFDKNAKAPIEVVSNPEFLKEGAAVEDFLRPDRVVIGCRTEAAQEVMRDLYQPFVKNGNPILFMDNVSAEMTKYAANAFLSVKISFINELANLADRVGADIDAVRKGFTSDSRINPAFFYPGVGFGGSCFPKDVKALIHTGNKFDIPMQVVTAADQVNDRQKLMMFDRMQKHFGSLQGKTIGVWGLAFKPRTDDVREAPALYMIEALVNAGATVKAYDPVARETAKQYFPVKFTTVNSADEAATGSDALLIVTEWNEFRTPDLGRLKVMLRQPVVFDGRNVLDPKQMKKAGFSYYCVGRETLAR